MPKGKHTKQNNWLAKAFPQGRCTRRQAEILSLNWPLKKGWLRTLQNRPLEQPVIESVLKAVWVETWSRWHPNPNYVVHFETKQKPALRQDAPVRRIKIPWVGKDVEANSSAFLYSYEWRRLRMVVLTKRGARCECCGASAVDGVRIHVDHIKPRRLHPELALVESNLQVLCADCNHGKGNWDQTDWRQHSQSVPPTQDSSPLTDEEACRIWTAAFHNTRKIVS